MRNGNRSRAATQVCRLVSLASAGEFTDAELLERFVARRDETAFEVLVWRHGPKVLGVCRRVLRRAHDAEDAFQATFLVLVRKAGSIGRRESVGSWLYRVAYRVALRARLRVARRAARESPAADLPAAESSPGLLWADLRPVLDEEVNRLPAKYRAPFILCYLDGKTNEQAARELGCPKGTVLSRLAWARERLRVRLTRRGVELSAGLAAVGLTAGAAPAAVPAALVNTTLRAALLVATGAAVADVVSGPVAALTKGALQAMVWTKGVILTGCVLAVGVLVVGGVPAWPIGGPRSVAGPPRAEPEKKADEKEESPPGTNWGVAAREPKKYAVEMRDQPWAKVFEWYADLTGLPYVGTEKPTGTFTFLPPQGKRQYTLEEITDILNEALLARKYILVRRDATFTVLPADEKVDPTLVPRVRLDELPKRGKTELVTVVLPLTHLSARDLGPEVRKLGGPFSAVVVLEKANQLVVQDTVGNLRQIHQTIQVVEAREAARIKREAEKK